MNYAFCSFSFHRLLAAGKQDIFQHITDVKALGACQIDPWNAHLAEIKAGDQVIHAGGNPNDAKLKPTDNDYITRIKEAADAVDLPFGCVAIDGAHIYDDKPEVRKANRAVAYRWLEVAELLGATQVRIDAGGPEDLPDHAFKIIVKGYRDLIDRAADKGLQVLTENHWGPTRFPENVVKLLENIDGLGLLFDTNNWAPGHQEEGWERCAKYAAETHVKTFEFNADGWDPTVDLKKAIDILIGTGYDGVWGIESCPKNGAEMVAARKTVELIKMALGE